MIREWGPWSEIKLDALTRYLSAFTIASKKAAGRTLYLDLFAGSADNVNRATGDDIEGSAVRALSTEPRFGKLVFCEMSPLAAASLSARLSNAFPGRDFVVCPQDCNVAIPSQLERLPVSWRMAPTFAFVDQYSAQVDWSTTTYLSTYKHPSRSKVEQWIYFGDSFYARGLMGPNGAKNFRFARRLDAMFGTTAWRRIMAAREDGVLGGREAQLELINLYRWRLVNDLGYRFALPLSVPSDDGRPLYTLIFASDHDAGHGIMSAVFDIAKRDLDAMVAQKRQQTHRDRRFGAGSPAGLFDAAEYFDDGSGAGHPAAPMLVTEPRVPFQYHREWRDGETTAVAAPRP